MDEMTIRTARRAADNPYFLAFALHQYAEDQQMDEPALTAALGATAETLAHARLCRTPRTDPDGFREDVTRIAARFGLNAAVLAEAVRAAEGATVLRAAAEQTLPETAVPMLAARDRTANPDSEAGG
jgi:protein-L-isoaspartate O-methyltransferase